MTEDRLAALERFVREDPSDPFNHYALGLEYLNRRDHDRALAALKEALRADPAYIAAYHQLGLLYAETGRRAEAREALNEGIRAARSVRDAHAAAEMTEILDTLEG